MIQQIQFFGPALGLPDAVPAGPDYRAAWGRPLTTPPPDEAIPGLPPIPPGLLGPIRSLVFAATFLRVQASAGARPADDDPEGLEMLETAESSVREWAEHCGLSGG